MPRMHLECIPVWGSQRIKTVGRQPLINFRLPGPRPFQPRPEGGPQFFASSSMKSTSGAPTLAAQPSIAVTMTRYSGLVKIEVATSGEYA